MMNLISFDPLRTLSLPGVSTIKPGHFFKAVDRIKSADWILFPEYWQVNALVFGLKRRIFPSLASYLLGHDKVEMTRGFLSVAPFHVPETLILSMSPENADAAWDQMTLPFVAKIPRSSMGSGVFIIDTRRDWKHYLEQTPVIYAQEYLPIDRDLRIVSVGCRIMGGFWRLQSDRGFHNNLSQGGQIDFSPIPPAAEALVTHLARELSINHGGFDIAMVGDHPYVLEFNRLFGSNSLNLFRGKISRAIMDVLTAETDIQGPNTPFTPLPTLPKAA
jgi:ribosomal protein S6--L-glutamate ligase